MKHFVIDVDGVMTDGGIYYTIEGKMMKRFGPDDHDALNLLRDKLEIFFISGDRKGFEISRKRISEHMNFDLYLVSTVRRVGWLEEKVDLSETIFMGDGIFDHLVFDKV
ncbi:MAG: phosphatase, partial [Dehalococcoidia bacterium]